MKVRRIVFVILAMALVVLAGHTIAATPEAAPASTPPPQTTQPETGSPPQTTPDKGPVAPKASPENAPAKTMVFWLQATNAPSEVRALGLEVWFDPQVLRFEKFTREALFEKGFAIFKTNVVEPGKLRMGGVQVGNTPLTPEVTGKMVALHFSVIGKGVPTLKLMNLKDDVSVWPVRIFQCDSKKKFSGLEICR